MAFRSRAEEHRNGRSLIQLACRLTYFTLSCHTYVVQWEMKRDLFNSCFILGYKYSNRMSMNAGSMCAVVFLWTGAPTK
jgi:hypothetical protein